MRGAFICLVGFLALLSAPTAAQGPSLSPPVTGVVLDSSGGALVGASVLYRTQAGLQRGTTDASGRFEILDVPASGVAISASFPDFRPETVNARPGAELRIVLQPDTVIETVTVSGTPPAARVTSATKTDTPLRDVPQAVSIVSRDLIDEQRMQAMADVVRYMPGVGIAQGEGNRDAPIMRGNATTSDFFVDGVRDDVQYVRDTYNVERVEALKGPNALAFGRGGAGGVINRVSRQADWSPSREVGVQLGSWNDRRVTTDLGAAVNANMAVRVTGMYQAADSYRDGVGLERYGLNPTASFAVSGATTIRVGYEYFHDDRTADRGVSSFGGQPLRTSRSAFFGDPAQSNARIDASVATAFAEHRFGNGVTLRNRVSYGSYDKFYQNVFPGAVNPAGTMVSLSAYNDATRRDNFFNQTDVLLQGRTGRLRHSVVAGFEFGRQLTANSRGIGFFTGAGANVTSISRPVESPTVSQPLEFRFNAADSRDNRGTARITSLYLQDQVWFTERIGAILGARLDHFAMDFRNNRTGQDLTTRDPLLSPRAGLIVKPAGRLSVYSSYSLSYLPRAGEQLTSLSLTNQALAPEQFRNYEAGTKWEITPALAFTAAAYQLDRRNVAIPDPVDPTRALLVDAQRSRGVELELAGRVTKAWFVTGGYAYQHGRLTETISATARSGASLPMTPTHSFSMWNKLDLSRRWSAGAGIIHRGESFTSLDNAVVLPSFTRVDGAMFFQVTPVIRAQVNVENVFDTWYFASAHNNTNITPGTPRAVRLSFVSRF